MIWWRKGVHNRQGLLDMPWGDDSNPVWALGEKGGLEIWNFACAT